jgi:hypothetical protein
MSSLSEKIGLLRKMYLALPFRKIRLFIRRHTKRNLAG